MEFPAAHFLPDMIGRFADHLHLALHKKEATK
jgi:hypothetical protein